MWSFVDLALTDVSGGNVSPLSLELENSASGKPGLGGGCRLSHQSETTSYIRRGTEGE
jgi:hypothetical protein